MNIRGPYNGCHESSVGVRIVRCENRNGCRYAATTVEYKLQQFFLFFSFLLGEHSSIFIFIFKKHLSKFYK